MPDRLLVRQLEVTTGTTPVVTPGLTVEITRFEVMQADFVARARLSQAQVPDNEVGIHVLRALGELAVAKYLDLYWPAAISPATKPQPRRGNIGGAYRSKDGSVAYVQVRTRAKDHYDLCVLDEEDERDLYVLVIGDLKQAEGVPPYQMKIVGWIRGAEARIPEWWRVYEGREPAYFVSQASLKPIELLRKYFSPNLLLPTEALQDGFR